MLDLDTMSFKIFCYCHDSHLGKNTSLSKKNGFFMKGQNDRVGRSWAFLLP